MKFYLLLVALVFVAPAASLSADDSNLESTWMCSAQGKQSFGGPVGDLWQTVTGTGATEFDAMDEARQNCFSQGLQMCMVNSCHSN